MHYRIVKLGTVWAEPNGVAYGPALHTNYDGSGILILTAARERPEVPALVDELLLIVDLQHVPTGTVKDLKEQMAGAGWVLIESRLQRADDTASFQPAMTLDQDLGATTSIILTPWGRRSEWPSIVVMDTSDTFTDTLVADAAALATA